MTLERLYTLVEVAEECRVSTKWLRVRCNRDRPVFEHIRLGHKISFTAEQVDKILASLTKTPVAESITTGPKRPG